MKIIKGLGIFLLITTMFGSCFEPPQYPVVPSIEFNKIEFVDASTDSLILYINFRDGDGDLGLDNQDLTYISDPFNNRFFFQEDNGSLKKVSTIAVPSTKSHYEILNVDPNAGTLVSARTRNKPAYSTLPAYNCTDYEYLGDTSRVLINKAYRKLLDPSVRIVDTLYSSTAAYYMISDTLLIENNPDHYNIEVHFLIKDPASTDPAHPGFTEFDWRKEFCGQTYDGRFPVLAQKSGALEGTLKYSMTSVGFINLFSSKPMKLTIQIKDRTLHKSNLIETPEFDLIKILRKSG